MNKNVKAYPTLKSINDYINFASVSGIIWRSHEISALSGIIMRRPILDIGCGNGVFSKIVFNDRLDWGLDIYKDLINEAKKNNSYRKYLVADAHKIPLKTHSIKTVFSNSVFEHIKELDGILTEISRVLKPGGELIFTTYSPLGKKFFLENLLKKFGLNKLASRYKMIFCRMLKIRTVWSLKTWEEKLKEKGFRIEESKEIISPYAAFLFEIFLPFAYFQNRVSILKKIPITKIIFSIINPDFKSTSNSGRNFFIRARKI